MTNTYDLMHMFWKYIRYTMTKLLEQVTDRGCVPSENIRKTFICLLEYDYLRVRHNGGWHRIYKFVQTSND